MSEPQNPDDSVHGLTPEQARARWAVADRYVKDIHDLRNRLESIERRLRQGNRTFQKVDQTLYDPKAGVIVQIDQLREDQKHIAGDVTAIKNTINRLAWVIVLAVVGGLLAMLGLNVAG